MSKDYIESNNEVKKGQVLFSVTRNCDNGEFCIWMTKVADIIENPNPKGRAMRYRIVMECINYTRGDNHESTFELKGKDKRVFGYYASPMKAVSVALRSLFDSLKGNEETSEARLLKAIFNHDIVDADAPKVTAELLPSVIWDLKQFVALYAEAAKIESEMNKCGDAKAHEDEMAALVAKGERRGRFETGTATEEDRKAVLDEKTNEHEES